jgi:hypothetical protein
MSLNVREEAEETRGNVERALAILSAVRDTVGRPGDIEPIAAQAKRASEHVMAVLTGRAVPPAPAPAPTLEPAPAPAPKLEPASAPSEPAPAPQPMAEGPTIDARTVPIVKTRLL